MPSASVLVASDVQRTARVMQMEGMFDVPPSKRAELRWDVNLPIDDRSWNVGLIVGPSGSGKSTVARSLWPAEMAQAYAWPDDKSVLDGFPSAMSIKDVIELLNSVGFSSPPSWVRPFHVLSTGEQFRVTMARVLAESAALAVVDEFTSVVDRTVAQIGSAALAKTIRRRGQQFIAVTCHEDVHDWLQPDWVYRSSTNEFTWRSVQRRPVIELEIFRVHHQAWRLFGRHHYLADDLNRSAHCFVASWHEHPVAFVAAKVFPHPTASHWKLHRLVCLPDYQGIGIGVAMADTVSSALKATGRRVTRTFSHPAVVSHCSQSPKWKRVGGMEVGDALSSRSGMLTGKRYARTAINQRRTHTFEYVGPPMDRVQAAALMGGER
jgi:ABC-type lipoprotein export system ATPase subunit/GNAT superfamily N-acetyltransferase